jgi:hypothetical protein
MEHARMHIRLLTNEEAAKFVSILNRDGSTIRWTLENADGHYRANARSLIGVLYFATEHNDDTFLVNDTDGSANFPSELDQFRVL